MKYGLGIAVNENGTKMTNATIVNLLAFIL